MAPNGGQTTNLSHNTTSPTSNPPNRKPVAERKDDASIVCPPTQKKSSITPKLCGNTYFVYRCGHKQATQYTGITHTEDCPGLPPGEWFCTNMNPSGIMIDRADEDCPRCWHKHKDNYPYWHPYYSLPYFGPFSSSRYPHIVPQQPILPIGVHMASPIHLNATPINSKPEAQGIRGHDTHDLYRKWAALQAFGAPGQFVSRMQELHGPLGPLPTTPPDYHDFNSLATFHTKVPGESLVDPLASLEQCFAPDHDEASTNPEAAEIKVKLPPTNAPRHDPSSVPISFPDFVKGDKEAWWSHRNNDPPHQLGRLDNSTPESQEHLQAQLENYLKDNKLPTIFARLYESVEFKETRDTCFSLKHGSHLGDALQNSGFVWPGPYCNDENASTIRSGSSEKIPLIPADSSEATEVQRPFPPRNSSLPLHAKHTVNLDTSSESNTNNTFSSRPVPSLIQQQFGHVPPPNHMDRLRNRPDIAALKGGISNTSRSTAFTGGVDKKFLNRPWRQPMGPSASTKGFSFGPEKTRSSQTPSSKLKAKERSPVEVVAANKSAVAIPQSPCNAETTEKSVPLVSTPEVSAVRTPLIDRARESRAMTTDSNQEKIPPVTESSYYPLQATGYSTRDNTLMTLQEQDRIKECRRALMDQQQNLIDSLGAGNIPPQQHQVSPSIMLQENMKAGTSQAPPHIQEQQAAWMQRQCQVLSLPWVENKLGQRDSPRCHLLSSPFTPDDCVRPDLKYGTSQTLSRISTAAQIIPVEETYPEACKPATDRIPAFDGPAQGAAPIVIPAVIPRRSPPIASDGVHKDKNLNEHSVISKDQENLREVSEEDDSWDVISDEYSE